MTPGQGDFEDFYRAHVARHASAANRWVVFIFDHVLVGSLLLALRRPKAGLSLYLAAFGVTGLGHAVLERNLGRELEAFVKAPLTALRAELRFVAAMWRKGPSTFDPALD